MRMGRSRAMTLAGAACTALLATAGGAAAATPKSPVKAITASGFGSVLATGSGQALYLFNKEADGKVRCTGACKAAWPVLYAPASGKVPKKLAGFKGTFGTVRRPDDKRLQVTWNGRPIYTYAHEGPRQVRCNDVGGWFVVRATGKIF